MFLTGKRNEINSVNAIIKWVEVALAVIIIIGVVVYIANSFLFFLEADWQDKNTIYEAISRVLFTTIGIELARMLVTHNFLSVVEFLVFIVARKMLKPDITITEIFVGVVSFVLLLIAYRYLIYPIKNINKKIEV